MLEVFLGWELGREEAVDGGCGNREGEGKDVRVWGSG